MTAGWGHPRDAGGFAAQWATEVRAARALGERVGAGRYLEVRYEALVAAPGEELRRVCAFAGLEYDDGMLGYVGRTDSARKDHQKRLDEPPRVGVRDWRTEMPAAERAAFEATPAISCTSSGTRCRHPAAIAAGSPRTGRRPAPGAPSAPSPSARRSGAAATRLCRRRACAPATSARRRR